MRGEMSVAELCRRERISQEVYHLDYIIYPKNMYGKIHQNKHLNFSK